MKIGNYDITLHNITKYATAKVRKARHYYGGDILGLDEHIVEQFEWRKTKAKAECMEKGACVECGCETPDLFYASEPCEGNCYPDMMDKEEWKKYKEDEGI